MLNNRILLLFYVLLIPLAGPAQKIDMDKLIPWDENRPLTWNDFKGHPDNRSHFYASTCAGVHYQLQQSPSGEITVKIATYFDPHKSWHKKKLSDDKMLEHEQRHFDIKELYSRYLVKNILEMDKSTGKDIFRALQQIYEQAMDDMNDFDDQYDRETRHSTDLEQQRLWNTRIKKLLTESKAYDREEVFLQ